MDTKFLMQQLTVFSDKMARLAYDREYEEVSDDRYSEVLDLASQLLIEENLDVFSQLDAADQMHFEFYYATSLVAYIAEIDERFKEFAQILAESRNIQNDLHHLVDAIDDSITKMQIVPTL